jgi:hypothetical protein
LVLCSLLVCWLLNSLLIARLLHHWLQLPFQVDWLLLIYRLLHLLHLLLLTLPRPAHLLLIHRLLPHLNLIHRHLLVIALLLRLLHRLHLSNRLPPHRQLTRHHLASYISAPSAVKQETQRPHSVVASRQTLLLPRRKSLLSRTTSSKTSSQKTCKRHYFSRSASVAMKLGQERLLSMLSLKKKNSTKPYRAAHIAKNLEAGAKLA